MNYVCTNKTEILKINIPPDKVGYKPYAHLKSCHKLK